MKNYFILFVLLCITKFSIGQLWVATSPGISGTIYDLSFQDDSIGWAVTFNLPGQVYKQQNYNGNWVLNNSFQNELLKAVCVLNDSTVIVGGIASNLSGAVIFRTTDSGQNWTSAGLNAPSATSINGFEKVSEDSVFAFGNNGFIYLSTNTGLSWNPYVSPTAIQSNIWDVNFDSDTLLIASDSGIHRIVGSAITQVYNISTDDIDYSRDTAFALSGNVILRSLDNGRTWQSIATTTLSVDSINTLLIRSPNHFFACGNDYKICYSNDGGSSWVQETPSISNFYLTTLTYIGNDMYSAGSFGQVVKRSISTGIEQTASKKPSLGFYPNPVQERIYLDKQLSSIEIINISGKIVFSQLNPKRSIDLSHFQPGVYIVRAMLGKEIYIQKIIKEN